MNPRSPAPALRDARPSDFEDILRLNAAEVRHTSPMDAARLKLLHGLSSYHRVAVDAIGVAAFLLAMREAAAYENENYAWFSARYERFVYIDRIVVSRDLAGQGIGSALYSDLFEYARDAGIEIVACEYNLEPPNPVSKAFHDRWGFTEVGSQRLADGSKRVSMQVVRPSRLRRLNG